MCCAGAAGIDCTLDSTSSVADVFRMEPIFSAWASWPKRTELEGLRFPGVYAMAISDEDLTGTLFSWRREIVYVGMTNSKGGLKSRLRQFDDTIRGRNGHGGAHRVRYKHRDYESLVDRLFVAVHRVECDVKSGHPDDLRLMGQVARMEYECFAQFAEKFQCLPEFNDMKRSPKKDVSNGQAMERS